MFESIRVGEVARPQVWVFAKFQDGALHASVSKHDVGGAIAAAAARPEFTGALGNIVEAFVSVGGEPSGKKKRKGEEAETVPTGAVRVMLVGLGKQAPFKTGDLRQAAGVIGRRLAVTKDEQVSVHLSAVIEEGGHDARAAGRAFGEGLGLLGWNNTIFKGKGTEEKKRKPLVVEAKGKAFAKGLEHGLALAESANLCRTLSETPPNIATPAYMRDQAKQLAKDLGLGFSVIEGTDLDREKMVGHVNVGKASENKPCVIRLAYTPAKAKKHAKPVVLIGKTVTYDTGGLSLKINNGMVGMKRDKDGGCAVLGAMHAIASVIKPEVPVVAILCAAENSISDEAYRPDDILTYRNGVTVEITNTDAEGRLVLADGLCWACEKEDPAAIIDLATLTGGVVVALGSTYCGLFCEDDKLRAKVEAAAATSGERVWRLPMHAEYRDIMKSPVADILNSNANRKAHPIQGAAFLSYFVKDGVPWCHLDIAGVHATESDSGPFVKGPTGWGVRILADLLAEW